MPSVPIEVIVSLSRPMAFFFQLLEELPLSVREFVWWCFICFGGAATLRILMGQD